MLPSYSGYISHPGWLLDPKSISFTSGLVEAGERKQASGLCSNTAGFVLEAASLWVPFGCKIRRSEKWGLLQISGPSDPCSQLFDLEGTSLLSASMAGAEPPRCNPGHLYRTTAKRKEAWKWICSINIYRATPPLITLHLDSTLLFITYFYVSSIIFPSWQQLCNVGRNYYQHFTDEETGSQRNWFMQGHMKEPWQNEG